MSYLIEASFFFFFVHGVRVCRPALCACLCENRRTDVTVSQRAVGLLLVWYLFHRVTQACAWTSRSAVASVRAHTHLFRVAGLFWGACWQLMMMMMMMLPRNPNYELFVVSSEQREPDRRDVVQTRKCLFITYLHTTCINIIITVHDIISLSYFIHFVQILSFLTQICK